MPLIRVLVLLASFIILSTGQMSDTDVKVWAAVAYINNGERTPLVGRLQTSLTPEGAQQLFRQGEAFRARYISSGNSSNDSSADSAPIQGIETSAIDNSQVEVVSQTDEWVVAGAMAFLQALYPPVIGNFSSQSGGSDMAHNLVNGSDSAQFPMSGYQYPKIETLSKYDSRSTSIQGTVGCSVWEGEMVGNLTSRNDLKELYNKSNNIYHDLFSSSPLQGTIPLDEANLWNASSIYDYVNYMFTHNQTVNKGLLDGPHIISELAGYAFLLEKAKNSQVDSNVDNPLNTLYTIAGRTLAGSVAQALIANLGNNAESRKLTLIFGSYEPMLSFFSIANLWSNRDTRSGLYSTLPSPGTAMIFELIGENTGPGTFPEADDLSIRFYYRASADSGDSFELESLFDSGFDGNSLPYSAFIREMQEAGRTADEWCSICKPTGGNQWCSASGKSYNGTDGATSNNGNISSALAGVIGAVSTVALLGLIFLGLFTVFGFRLRRDSSVGGIVASNGFRKAEKMPGDRDVVVSKGGAGEERIGSWEMRDTSGESKGPIAHDGDGGRSFSNGPSVIITYPRRQRDDVDDDSITNVAPTRVHEGV